MRTRSSAKNRARHVCRALFLLACGLSACQSYLFDPADAARERVRAAGWTESRFDASRFTLVGFHPAHIDGAENLHVYIEGDGHAWASRSRPANDPTPLDPVALDLALEDPTPSVLYLGRPCQYVREIDFRGCESRIWTSHRFSEPVIAAIDAAITAFADRVGARHILLVGYSGGGAIAALLAARRHDVSELITVAGTLDHAAWTEHHGVSPLSGSENPRDFADRLAAIPQVHYVGADDDIMPETVARSFFNASPPNHRARLVVIPGYGHECCWSRSWPNLLKQAISERPSFPPRPRP
jgi:dienelactone hydrolase